MNVANPAHTNEPQEPVENTMLAQIPHGMKLNVDAGPSAEAEAGGGRKERSFAATTNLDEIETFDQ